MKDKPILIHTHFHYQRTGVTRSIENVLPFLNEQFEVYVAGKNVDVPTISFLKMMKLAFSKRKTIIHCHRNNEILRALLVRVFGAKFRLISTRHAETEPSGFTTLLHKKTDEVITLTQKMSEMFSFPTEIIGHGIDVEKFVINEASKIPDVKQKHIITCAGRVRKAKGQQVLVEAIAPVLKKFQDWALVIVGKIDGAPLVKELQQFIADHEVSDQCYFVNETSDIITYYQGSHSVVVPSYTEGFSLVCGEAMACGCNVIATAGVGIHANLIENGKNGYLFEAGEREELSKLMRGIMNGDRKHCGTEARQTVVASWSAAIEADKLTKIYLRS